MLPRLSFPCVLSFVLLSGCAVAPPDAYSFDPTKPIARPVADPAYAAATTQRIARLQLELGEVRAKIAVQPDAWQRLPLYREENRIHRELAPLQRELARYALAR